jgi:hypothetical protein
MDLEILVNGRDDMRGVSHLLTDFALRRFQTNAPALMRYFCTSRDHGEIVACCGGTLASEGKLYLEDIYLFADDVGHLLEDSRATLAEIGRWMSLIPDHANGVLRGLIEHLQLCGATSALCELSRPSFRRARALGLTFEPVQAQLVLANVDPTGRSYYLDKTPEVYLLEFSQIRWRF